MINSSSSDPHIEAADADLDFAIPRINYQDFEKRYRAFWKRRGMTPPPADFHPKQKGYANDSES